MKLEGLPPELQEKVKACGSGEEFVELAKSEGVELADEDLDTIAGGWEDDDDRKYYCPHCRTEVQWAGTKRLYHCPKCNIDGLDLSDLYYSN